MKRGIGFTVLALLLASNAHAQTATPPSAKPIAEVAKEEEARRKSVRKPSKVYTNGDLRPDISKGIAPPSLSTTTVASTAASGNTSAANASPAAPAAGAAPGAAPALGQDYWAGRIKTARDALQRSQIFADSLQSRINGLLTEYVNRDDPAQRSRIEADRNTALAELEKVKKEIADQTKAIAAIEDEARRAGVPAGWLRPGV